MKTFLVILAPVLVLFVVFILWYRWDSGTNHGYQFGYYGEFNRISNALASIPGITITQSWHNCDVTLEEFGFIATTRSGESVQIALGERDRIRSLSGESLVHALTTEIQSRTRK